MANPIHLSLLEQGIRVWNEWRAKNPQSRPDLSGMVLPMRYQLEKIDFSNASLHGSHLTFANLRDSDLRKADLSEAYLTGVDLSNSRLAHACFRGAKLEHAQLQYVRANDADFTGATLSNADMSYSVFTRSCFQGAVLLQAQIRKADLSSCDLTDADLLSGSVLKTSLRAAKLIRTDLQYCSMALSNLEMAEITDCLAYGSAAWDIELDGAQQSNIRVTLADQPVITVDNLEVAQFINLLLGNKRIRNIIDTITSKVVLILGRFGPERKLVLDAMREELRKMNYTPVLFDFGKPMSRDITETVSTLAHMARFIIADLTDAKSIPQELHAIVPNLPSVPVQPLLLASQDEYGMFEHFKSYPWVLETHRYEGVDELLGCLLDRVIAPAEARAKEITAKRSKLEDDLAKS